MNMITNISKSDRFIFWFYQLMSRIQGGFMALLSGFLLGRVTNELSVQYTDWLGVLKGLFSTADRPANFLTWLSLALLVAIPLVSRILAKLYKRRQYKKIENKLLTRIKGAMPLKIPYLPNKKKKNV